MKRIILVAAIASAFLIGYAGASEAWPGVPDRSEHRGYFDNRFDDRGDDVWEGGYPSSVNTANEFISYTKNKLNNGSARERVGAAFIIQTMIGLSRREPPSAAQIADWESRVRYADAQDRIDWTYNFRYSVNSYYQGSYGGGGDPKDDAFFYDRGAQSSMVFRDEDGDIVYSIRRVCANPVGNIAALPEAVDFNMSGRSTVSDSSPKPGDTITFRHYIRNEGPTDTDPTNIYATTYNTLTGSIIYGPASSGEYSDNQEKNVSNETVFIPSNTPVGTRYCRQVGYQPRTESGSSGRGAAVCATVVPDYNLTPQVQASKSTVQEGDQVTFTYTVSNGGPTDTGDVACKVVGNNHGPGYSPLPQQDVDRSSDAGYDAPSTNCPREFDITTGAPVQVATETVTIAGLPPGTRICRSLVVNPKSDSGGFRSSAEQCVVVAKTPYVHFLGSDVWAGGGFEAVGDGTCNNLAEIETRSNNLSGSETAGSGSAYAAFALGKITQFGSASKALLSGGGGADGKNMTFSNTDDDNLGFYGAPQHCIEDYVDKYQSSPAIGPGSFNLGAGGSGQWRVTGNATFHGNMASGARKVYLVQGNVTIDGNIAYGGTYSSVNAIPSLVIIATGNVYVRDNVEQADGIFVTRGTFFTCNPKNEPATTNTCNQQLKINGAVKANRIDFFRTFGAEGSSTEDRQRPAEIFNLPSELYLRNALNTSSEAVISTDSVQELPPRF